MDFWQVLEGRKSVRDFQPDAVPRDVLERIMSGAVRAPSAMNAQPWEFHVCEGASRAKVLAVVSQATVHLLEYMDVLGPERYEDAVKWYSSLGDAPVLVVITMKRPTTDFDQLNLTLSVGTAIENLLLGATAEGLGACNVTFGWWVRDELLSTLGAAEDQVVASIVAVGYPSNVPPAAPPRREDAVHWHD